MAFSYFEKCSVEVNDLQSLQLEEFALPAVWRPIFKVKTSSAGTQWVTMHAGLAVSQALVISDYRPKM